MATLAKLIVSIFLTIASFFVIQKTVTKRVAPPTPYFPQPIVINHGPRTRGVVALTFDADMTPKMKRDLESGKVKSWYNKRLIDILTADKVPATLFLTGMWIELYPNVTRELAKNPLFELGNHSYSHPAFERRCTALTLISHQKDYDEIEKTQKLLLSVAGVDNHIFRFPGGCYDAYALSEVHKLDLDAIGWDVTSSDAFNPNEPQLISNVLNHAQNGSIILMHMIGNRNAPETAIALPSIISGLRARGFSFAKVSELIR